MNEYEWISIDEYNRRSREIVEEISPGLHISDEVWDRSLAGIIQALPVRMNEAGDCEIKVRKAQDGMDTGDIDSYSRS